MLDNDLFSNVTNDIYLRKYDLNPQFANGQQVFVYAESSLNTERVNGHYYHLEIYFSVDNYCTRDFLIGVTFGTEQLDKRHMDAEMDRWVDQIVREDTFPEYLKNYMKAQDLWEDTLNDEYLNGSDNAE